MQAVSHWYHSLLHTQSIDVVVYYELVCSCYFNFCFFFVFTVLYSSIHFRLHTLIKKLIGHKDKIKKRKNNGYRNPSNVSRNNHFIKKKLFYYFNYIFTFLLFFLLISQ